MTFSSGPPSSGGGKLPRPARRVVASFIQGKTTLAIDQWLVAVDEKLLVVTGHTSAARYSESADELVEMIASLKVRGG